MNQHNKMIIITHAATTVASQLLVFRLNDLFFHIRPCPPNAPKLQSSGTAEAEFLTYCMRILSSKHRDGENGGRGRAAASGGTLQGRHWRGENMEFGVCIAM